MTPEGEVAPPSPAPSATSRAVSSVPPRAARPTAAPEPAELVRYVLELVNKDRADHGLSPVGPGNNAAAQRHAEDMLAEYYLAHWDTAGMKPYMRYTAAGGVNYEGENSAYSGWYDKSEDPARYVPLDVKQELKELEYRMMYDDAESNWGHRDNILNARHKQVNIGIAHDGHRLTLVQQFEGDYVELSTLPQLANGVLTAAGWVSLGVADSVAVFYDPLPQPMTQADLQATPHSYSLGRRVVTVLPPPPTGYTYSRLPEDAMVADLWEAGPTGSFRVQAGIGQFLVQNGPGVYTVVIWTKADGEYVALTNYSLFVP
jgi:hypothetical protein